MSQEQTNPQRESHKNRGQILLLTGVTIALVLLGLIAIVNISGFSQLESAEGGDMNTYSLLEKTNEIEQDGITILRNLNTIPADEFGNPSATHTDRLDALNQSIDQHLEDSLNTRLNVEQKQAKITNRELYENGNGTRIWVSNPLETIELVAKDSSTGNYTTFSDYHIVDDTVTVREFTIGANPDSFNPVGTPPTIVIDKTDGSTINIHFEEGTKRQIRIDNTSTTGDTTITKKDFSGDFETSGVSNILWSEIPLLSITNGNLDRDRIDDVLPPTTEVEQITIQNGDNLEATYNIVINETDEDNVLTPVTNGESRERNQFPTSTINSSKDLQNSGKNTNPGDPPIDQLAEHAPENHKAIFAVRYTITITTPKGSLTTRIEVTPGTTKDVTEESLWTP